MRKDWTKADITEILKTQKSSNPFGNYNNKQFWDEYGKDYIRTFGDDDKDKMMENLMLNMGELIGRINLLSPIESLLEIGCGFGRVLAWLWVGRQVVEFKRLEGVEISQTMIDNGLQYFKDCNLEVDDPLFPKIVQCDVTKGLPYKDKEFEMIYTHVCLTHIPPQNIPGVLKEIDRVASKYIILTERFKFPYEHGSPHVWSHNLAQFFVEQGWEVINHAEINSEHCTKMLTLERK